MKAKKSKMSRTLTIYEQEAPISTESCLEQSIRFLLFSTLSFSFALRVRNFSFKKWMKWPSPSESRIHVPCVSLLSLIQESHLTPRPSGPDPARSIILSLPWGHWSRAVTFTTATGPGPAGSHIHTLWVGLTQASYSAVSPSPNQAINHNHAPTPWVSLSFLLCYLSKPSQDPHWGISWISPYLTLPLKCPDTPATTEPEWPSLSSKNSTLSIWRADLITLPTNLKSTKFCQEQKQNKISTQRWQDRIPYQTPNRWNRSTHPGPTPKPQSI